LLIIDFMLSSRAVTAFSAAAAAGGIGVAVKSGATASINHAVRTRIHPRRSPALRSFAKGISNLVDPHAHPFAAGALGILIHIKGGRGGAAPGVASLGALAVDNGTRLFIHQRRPPKAGRHHGRNRYAYPSGHVTAATAIAVATANAIAEDLSPSARAFLWASVGGVALAVGWSRLYLDEHWIDDVVGGWMAGVAIGLGAVSLSAF
jgi:membrane-associated phospholipid phosphatase